MNVSYTRARQLEKDTQIRVLVTEGPETFRLLLIRGGQAPEPQQRLDDIIEVLLSTELGRRMLVHYFSVNLVKVAAEFVRDMARANIPSRDIRNSVRDISRVLAYAFAHFEAQFLGENWNWSISLATDECEEILEEWDRPSRGGVLGLIEQIAFTDGFVPPGSVGCVFMYSQWRNGVEDLLCSRMDEISQGLIECRIGEES